MANRGLTEAESFGGGRGATSPVDLLEDHQQREIETPQFRFVNVPHARYSIA